METRIPLLSLEEEQRLFGPHDRHVKLVARKLGVRFSSRGGQLRLRGDESEVTPLVTRVEELLVRLRAGEDLHSGQIEDKLLGRGVELTEEPHQQAVVEARRLAVSGSGRGVGEGGLPSARTETQQVYMDLMQESELVFAAGPAGTGKTYLAVAAAVRALRDGKVQRLVLTRPAVEAGENLGFLPGDLEEKIDPYLRPLFDALNDLLGPAATRRMRDMDMIEIAPLAFMRGRTFNDSFVILDEAQNATHVQMKMFLTRLGEGTRAVVTGDISQTDLPKGRSGLADAMHRLEGVQGIGGVVFHRSDVQRSRLVERIIEAYGEDEG